MLESTETLSYIGLAAFFGGVIGYTTCLLFSKAGTPLDKKTSVLVLGVWLCAHISGMAFNVDVPFLFDVVGAGAAGNLIGINLFDQIVSLKK